MRDPELVQVFRLAKRRIQRRQEIFICYAIKRILSPELASSTQGRAADLLPECEVRGR